tara:strand:+ start:1082 stop:4099 length:3018 start_codon:yes stop_codon:yes gene_type:complete
MKGEEISDDKENILIILSAKCDKNKKLHSLKKVGTNKKTVIDIQLDSLPVKFKEKYVVLGELQDSWYKNDFIKIINNDWNTSKSGYSLSLAIQEINPNGSVWIIYSDILFRDIDISKSMKNQNTVFIDNEWETRIANRKIIDNSLIELVQSDKDSSINLFFNTPNKFLKDSSEMCGIIKLNNKSFYKIKSLIKSQEIQNLKDLSTSELLEISRLNGIRYKACNISGKYCQLNIDDDLIKYFLGTKAETLEKLRMIGLKNGIILDQYKFTIDDWNRNSDSIIKKIIKDYKNTKIVIRSSCFEEDQKEISAAGKFESQLAVPCDQDSIFKSISKVIKSYGTNIDERNQVFVQKFLSNVDLSGVAFSRMIESNGPYFSINISYEDTTKVTSGSSCHEYFINRKNINLIKDKNLNKIIECLLEIENLLNFRLIDMEFAIVNNKVIVLQVRPLVIDNKYCLDEEINKNIMEANYEIKNLFKKQNKIYSLMSDWNPAEIIGKLPPVLSSSIYKYIITDKNWSLSRKLDGYKDINSPLLINILGTDYVDVNKSIKSLIPNDLPDDITKKIEDIAYKFLSNNPSLHDKIEFEIIPTCIDLNWNKWEAYLKDSLKNNELKIYKKSLIKNTKKIMEFTIKSESQKSIKEILDINTEDPKIKLIKAIELLTKIKDQLAVEFARSARRAFIITSWLKSGLEKNIISKRAELGFYKSLNTISSDFIKDTSNKNKSKDEIYFKYGHLRPSSYDIQSNCYLYRNINNQNLFIDNPNKDYDDDIKIWEKEKEELLLEIKNLLNFKSTNFVEKIMKDNVNLREKNKFEFTKLLSASLELIADYCQLIDISRYQASHISIQTFKDIAYSNNGSGISKELILEEFNKNEIKRKIYEFIYKPDIFINGNELLFDKSINCRPTYIGDKITESNVIKLKESQNSDHEDLENKIILIENADPGYDFIFGYKIKGLITMYGGSNSHMTIRCSELNVTAVIGVGHKVFSEIKPNSIIQINPKLKKITSIS